MTSTRRRHSKMFSAKQFLRSDDLLDGVWDYRICVDDHRNRDW